jgi:hypothetical protein
VTEDFNCDLMADEQLDLLAVGRHGADGRVLVLGHQARVADYICHQNSGESVLSAFGSHAVIEPSASPR